MWHRVSSFSLDRRSKPRLDQLVIGRVFENLDPRQMWVHVGIDHDHVQIPMPVRIEAVSYVDLLLAAADKVAPEELADWYPVGFFVIQRGDNAVDLPVCFRHDSSNLLRVWLHRREGVQIAIMVGPAHKPVKFQAESMLVESWPLTGTAFLPHEKRIGEDRKVNTK